MNWHTLLSFPDSADWIFLTAFHSLWLSLTAYLMMRFRKFRSPVIRSAWCTCLLILLLVLPLITWSIPRVVVRTQPPQPAAVDTTAAGIETQVPLLNKLLDVNAPLSRSGIGRGKALMNGLGLLWLAVTLICAGRLLHQLAFLKGYCTGMREIRDGRISAVLKDSEHAFRFRRKPRFFASHRLESPISTGIQTP